GYAKSFGAQMGWEYDDPAELQQDVLLGIGQGAEKVNIIQTQAPGLFAQSGFHGTRANDHHRVIGVPAGVEQDMQSLVITHDPDEQEEAIGKTLLPVGHASRIHRGVAAAVQSVGNDIGLVPIVRENVAGGQVVG